jgi:hypothetical protein
MAASAGVRDVFNHILFEVSTEVAHRGLAAPPPLLPLADELQSEEYTPSSNPRLDTQPPSMELATPSSVPGTRLP